MSKEKMSNLTFNDLVTIYRATRKVPGSSEGAIEIVDESVLLALQKAISDENWEKSGIETEVDQPNQLTIGGTYEIKLGTPRTGLGTLAQDVNDLIESPRARIVEPNAYFILDENFSKSDLIVPDSIQKYRKMLDFLSLLKDCAAYVDVATAELIFLQEGKFSIPVNYSKLQIDQVDFSSIKKIQDFFSSDTHRDQKIVILRDAVLSVLQISARSKRFVTLLAEIATVLGKLSDGYNIFVADFSYDKIKEQFADDKIEYSNRIHKVFSDIQSQLLSIPVATVIVATQMKVVKDGSGIFANMALLGGAWVFSIIFCLLCYNQWKTLSTISVEIKGKEKIIKEEYEIVNQIFENIFLAVHQRIKQQYIFLGVIIAVLLSGLIATHIFYFKIQSQNDQTQVQDARPKSKN